MMTDLQYKILGLIYNPSIENIEYNREYLKIKAGIILETDVPVNQSEKEYLEYINLKNELTKNFLLSRRILGKEALGVINDDIKRNFKELSDAGFIDVRSRNLSCIEEFRHSDVLLTDIGKEVFVQERDIRNQKNKRENALYNAQIENIEATKTALKFNIRTFWAIFIYTIATIIGLIKC